MSEPTPQEVELIEALGEIWNRYLKLPKEHPMGSGEFCTMIHRCQDAIASRATYRLINSRP